MKKCPFCAEDIQDAAVVCSHCGRDLPDREAEEWDAFVKSYRSLSQAEQRRTWDGLSPERQKRLRASLGIGK